MLKLRNLSKLLKSWKSRESYVRQPFSNHSSNKPQQRSLGTVGLHGYSLLAIPVVTFGLGTWQIYRRQWKLELIENLRNKTSEPPIPLPHDIQNLENLSEMEYRNFELKGRFLHDKEVYIGPRSIIGNETNEPSGMLSSGQSGYCVVTPFQLTDSNLIVLVNRGWIPRKKLNPYTRLNGQPDGEVQLTGVFRLNEARPQFVPQNNPKERMFHYRDVESMARLLDTAPLFFDAAASSTVPDGPIGGQTVLTVRNEHFSYILTWYSLSAITSFLWYRRFLKGIPLM